MRHLHYYMLLAASAVLTVGCSDSNESSTSDDSHLPTIDTDMEMAVSIDCSQVFQTIDGFSSSDAWNMDYVGKYWAEKDKEGIARLLFSQGRDYYDQPEGIGLSMWRVNVGGGSAEQGDASGINDQPERRAECFLNADGSYSWNKASGQQYFMRKALEYGVDNFVLFSNTPPVYYTKNGLGFSNSGANTNLKDDCYGKFADFLATVAEHFSSEGYPIKYVSPVNEPQYNWDGGQEGSGWQNSEVAKLVRELDGSLTAKGLSDTKIMVGEAGAWNYLYESGGDEGRGNVINNFFDPASENYIGDLAHVPSMVCAHSYWLDTSWNELQTTRAKVADAAKARGLSLYQTEWCMMSEKYEGISNYDNASYMDLALAMAQVIHTDLTVANVTSWSYWTTCERERWSQKSRFYLIRLTPAGGDYGDLDEGGTYTASKNLWVLGNYSLFIRPGYRRVAATPAEQGSDFLVSAYVSPGNDKLVVVYVNLKKESVKVENTISGGVTASDAVEYITSEGRDLREVGSEMLTVVPARSVATIVYNLN